MVTSVYGRRSPVALLVIGFVAGALAVFIFHQLTILLLSLGAATPGNVYSMRPIPPFGVPAVFNQAFWGGLWGCVFALVADRFPRSWPLWLAGLVFGAVGPTLVGWFVVAPLKGNPVAQGFDAARMWRGPVINGMFGLGLGIFFDLLRRLSARARWA
ncbi:MAG TPA: hypothetical protein VH835_01625 [Dongiaceae bacterium]|jgi:hypothetical protein